MSRFLTYLMLLLAIAFWGCSFILTKEVFGIEPQMTPVLLVTMRIAIAALLLVPSLAVASRLERLRRGDLKWFLLLAFAEPFLYGFCETAGTNLVSASLASLVVATIPVFVPVGMWLVYRQRIRPTMAVGALLSLLGLGLTVVGDGGLSGDWRGLLLLVAAVVVAVAYMLVLVKVVDHYRPVTVTAYQNLIGLAYYLPLLFLTGGPQLAMADFSPRLLLPVGLLGVCCSGLAYVFYNYAVRDLGASKACIFYNTTPLVSITAAALIGQEHPTWLKLLGAAIVIAGVFIAQRQPRGN